MCIGREHREYKRDKARRCSRPARPFKEIGKEPYSTCRVSLTTRTGS